MPRINNIDVARLQQTIADTQASPTIARRTQKIQGEWLLEEGGPQFRAHFTLPSGETTLESDMPPNLGGGSSRVGHMYYVYYGLAANYAFFFAAQAGQMGIELQRFGVTIEIPMNFTQAYGLGTAPIIEEVRFTLSVKSNAPPEQLREAERLALERCPAIYALTAPVKVSSHLEITA